MNVSISINASPFSEGLTSMPYTGTGTMDQTQFITIPDGTSSTMSLHSCELTIPVIALAFREWLGGEKAIYDYCHQLAMDGAKKLAEVMGTQVIDETGELTATMVSVPFF